MSVREPWLIAGHAFRTGPLDPQGMWHRELQQHASLHHRNAGIVFGGGNALAQEEFSTLVVGGSHLCDTVTITDSQEDRQLLELSNSGWRIAVAQRALSDEEASITVDVLDATEASAWFQLDLCLLGTRTRLLADGHVISRFDAAPVTGMFAGGCDIEGAGRDGGYRIEVRCASPCAYRWPIEPVNVRLPGRTGLGIENAVLLLRFALPARGQLSMRVTCRPM